MLDRMIRLLVLGKILLEEICGTQPFELADIAMWGATCKKLTPQQRDQVLEVAQTLMREDLVEVSSGTLRLTLAGRVEYMKRFRQYNEACFVSGK